MKKSKLILFSYIGFLALVFLVFVIYITATDGKRKLKKEDIFSEVSVDLPSFNYLKVAKQHLYLKTGDVNKASVSYFKDSIPPEIVWRMEGDTLCIESSKDYRHLNLDVVHMSRISISSTGATVNFNKVTADTLVLYGNLARFEGFRNSESGLLQATLLKSNLIFYSGTIGTAEIDIDDSHFEVRNSIKTTSGIVRNASKVELRKVRKINLDVDESSRLSCYR